MKIKHITLSLGIITCLIFSRNMKSDAISVHQSSEKMVEMTEVAYMGNSSAPSKSDAVVQHNSSAKATHNPLEDNFIAHILSVATSENVTMNMENSQEEDDSTSSMAFGTFFRTLFKRVSS